MGKDLGTYHVKVEFKDGQGFIYEWGTNGRYCMGMNSCHPLNATYIPPVWDDEEDLIHSIIWQFTEGNYGCDCNRNGFLKQSRQEKVDWSEEVECSDNIKLLRLTVIRPDRSEQVIYENK